MARDKRVEGHEAGEKKPCAECRAELALLQRAQELQEQGDLHRASWSRVWRAPACRCEAGN
jgi:hypothetical protein